MQQNKDKKVAVLLKASETNMHDTVSLSRLRGLKLAITFPANNSMYCTVEPWTTWDLGTESVYRGCECP